MMSDNYTIFLDDRFEDLEKIMKVSIDEIKKANHEELMKICDRENLDPEDMIDEEIRDALVEFYSEEIDDEA